MAFYDERSLITVEQQTWHSHEILYSFKVFQFPLVERVEFDQIWETECSQTPTIWRITVIFFRPRPPDVACHVLIKRLDRRAAPVRFSFMMDMFDVKDRPLVDTRRIPEQTVEPGQLLEDIWDPVLSLACINKLFATFLCVRIRMTVKNCHPPRKPCKPCPDLSLEEYIDMLFSKL